ncbi:MAG: 23S rRNA (adenine(2503)-C(2))-methyltransferase RlmN [Lachnospiraceae bacterium]|nr:23S rRNA (adenine(2503)-C(2))-methyltransferase RlmN [Lachnospiraceae bacterium]
MNGIRDLRSYTYDEISKIANEAGAKPYVARQIFGWLHDKKTDDISSMTNVSKSVREFLAKEYPIRPVKRSSVLISQIDGTRKYIHSLYDGNIIETVMLPYDFGNSACISSQAGCRMGCAFCASTIDGLARNLTAGEMAAQIYSLEEDAGERINHVVIMGSGEPFDNYDELDRFIRIITDERGANLSGRNITVSTCGIVPKIREFANRKYALTLALSLHAVTDEKRKKIMPIAARYPLSEVLDACRYYFDATGRRITLEYSLISGFNDSDEDMKGLASIARDLSAHVNLIPVNPIKERNFAPTSPKDAILLKNKLEKNNINVTIRREMGRDISGACGQLRRSFSDYEVYGDRNA